MFKHSPIYRFLDKNTWLQVILVIFPIMLLGIYIYSYMTDLSKIVYMLDNNNTVAQKELKEGNLYELASYSGTQEDSVGYLKIDNNKELVIDNEENEVFTVIFYDEQFSDIIFADDTYWKVPSTLLFENIKKNADDTYTFKYLNHEYTTTEKNDMVYTLYITGLNKFRVEFTDDFEKEFEGHPNIQFQTDTEPYNLLVGAVFEKHFNNFVINYASDLPTDNVYYSMTSGVFLKNISKDFGRLFVKNSNMIIVCMAMLTYLVLLAICRYRTDFAILGSRQAFALDFVLIILSISLILVLTVAIL